MVKGRKKRAQSLLEVTLGLVVLLFVSLALADLAIVILAVSLNSSACQNAACAAAAGDPSLSTKRAQAVLDNVNSHTQGELISNFHLVRDVEMTITDSPLKQARQNRSEPAAARNPGGPVTGTATVLTQVSVKPFVIGHLLFIPSNELTFQAKQSFPITYIMPPSLTSAAENDERSVSSTQDNYYF